MSGEQVLSGFSGCCSSFSSSLFFLLLPSSFPLYLFPFADLVMNFAASLSLFFSSCCFSFWSRWCRFVDDWPLVWPQHKAWVNTSWGKWTPFKIQVVCHKITSAYYVSEDNMKSVNFVVKSSAHSIKTLSKVFRWTRQHWEQLLLMNFLLLEVPVNQSKVLLMKEISNFICRFNFKTTCVTAVVSWMSSSLLIGPYHCKLKQPTSFRTVISLFTFSYLLIPGIRQSRYCHTFSSPSKHSSWRTQKWLPKQWLCNICFESSRKVEEFNRENGEVLLKIITALLRETCDGSWISITRVYKRFLFSSPLGF